MRIHGESTDGRVAPPQHAAGAAQREQVAAHEYRHRASAGHTGAASNGSDSEPPGTIIGKTLASCSIVAISAMFIWNPPSPEIAHTGSFGRARRTPIAAGTANPIAPRPPDVMCVFGRWNGYRCATHI